jgi:hypothetical protein
MLHGFFGGRPGAQGTAHRNDIRRTHLNTDLDLDITRPASYTDARDALALAGRVLKSRRPYP